MRYIAALIAALFAGSAFATYTYTDKAGVRLRLMDAPCVAKGAIELFIAQGVPPQVAAMAQGAEVVNGRERHAACYLVHPAGLVFVVTPALGDGLFVEPTSSFTKETSV